MPQPTAKKKTAVRKAAERRTLEGTCPRCGAPFAVRLPAVPDKPWLDIPCGSCGRTFRLRFDGIEQA